MEPLQSLNAEYGGLKERHNSQDAEDSDVWEFPGSKELCQEGCMMNFIITCPPKFLEKDSGQMTEERIYTVGI